MKCKNLFPKKKIVFLSYPGKNTKKSRQIYIYRQWEKDRIIEEIAPVENWVNNRPMKILNHMTPEKVFNFIVLRLLLKATKYQLLRFVTNIIIIEIR